MTDNFRPIDFDLAKRLHGHVRVETRDRWTGRVVESQEKENLVTDAAAKMIQTAQFGNLNNWVPVYSTLLGGLMLFDNTLTENASNIYFPSSAKLVGYAGQVADSSNTLCGSYNANESIFTSNGFTTVWDFLTSQANGTIASLARTSHMIKDNPLFGYSYSGSSFGTSGTSLSSSINVIGYDETNHILYFTVTTDITDSGISLNKNTIYKESIYIDKIGLTSPINAQKAEAVKTLTSSDGTASAYNWVYDKYDNNFVYIASTTIHLVAIDGTHTTKTATGVSGQRFAVTENYYWVANGTTLYRIQKSNTANIQTYTVQGTNIAPSENDILYAWPSGFGNMSRVYPDGTVITLSAKTASSTQSFAQSDYKNVGTLFGVRANGTAVYALTNYLGTIANLDSAVTKTSSQTMKITYTLTEA